MPYKKLQKDGNSDLISGAVYSSARNGSKFNDSTNLPVLFLAHEKDGCPKSTTSNSRAEFEKLNKANQSKTQYVLLHGGEAEPQNPCYSGFHMFYGASEEAYIAIDRFIND